MSSLRSRFEAPSPLVERRASELARRVGIYSRLWQHGPGAQCQVWSDVACALGPARGRAALKALEAYWAAAGLRDRTPSGAGPCACGVAELLGLIVNRIALGDRATAARLAGKAAPDAPVETVLIAAEGVARAFLGSDADTEQYAPPAAGECPTAGRTAAASGCRASSGPDPVGRRITHRHPSRIH